MQIDAFRDHCLAKPAVTEGFPFGEQTLVFKVAGKMFALLGLDAIPPTVNLKCDPERALELREAYEDVRPGYHMNKRHWNTVVLRGDVPAETVRQLADHSYDLVVMGLTRKARAEHGLDGAS